MKFGSLLDYKLFNNSKACEAILLPLMNKQTRKQFGLLESPSLSSDLYDGVVSYKLFICGKTATGKTSMIAKLLGKEYLEPPSETLGIDASIVYWPARIIETNKTIIFKISFWDAGEANLNAYNYLLPSCLQDVDAVLYAFSLKSKGSWDALPSLITKVDVGDDILQACVGTQLDLNSPSEISMKMVTDFEEAWKFPVLTIRDIGPRATKFRHSFEAFSDVAPLMNRLCELLWYNDQVKAGLVQKTLVDYCFADEKRESEIFTQDDIEKRSTLITFC